jgi:hypothetical protein
MRTRIKTVKVMGPIEICDKVSKVEEVDEDSGSGRSALNN